MAQYSAPRQERNFRRVVSVDLDDDRFDPVFRYAMATNPDRPVQDAIRDLLLQAVEADAKDGTIRAARRQAYIEARNQAFLKLSTFLRHLAAETDVLRAQTDGTVETSNTITPGGVTIPEAA